MNQAAQAYWNEFWKGQEKPRSVSEWKFGVNTDYLAQLVIDAI